MNILIDINHPAHVHMFRCFAHEMQSRGHKVLFTTRDKEFELKLLRAEGFDFVSFGKKKNGLLGKILFNLLCELKMVCTARRFKADLFLSHGSFVAAHAARLLGKPAIAFEDTFNMEQVKLYVPFTDVILTSDYEHPIDSPKVLKYAGYNELLYLHPNRFTPDASVLKQLGVAEDEKYVVMRFVSWNATHDMGHRGVSLENKIRAVKEFSKYARVFISSEKELPEELKPYKLPTAPEQIDNVMAYASLVFGESATMVSEGVMLGVPGVYLDNTGRLYTFDQERTYDMCYCYSESPEDQDRAIEKGAELLQRANLREEWAAKREKLLNEKIDATAFLVWLVENYPQSVEEYRKDRMSMEQRFR